MPSLLTSRSVARLTACGFALFSLAASGCAHAPPSAASGTDASPAPLRSLASRPTAALTSSLRTIEIARPESRMEARGMLERAFEASSDGNHALAISLYGAVLATDYLTDKGRANLYWMRAESFSELGDERSRRDALMGFLVASELPPSDNDLVARRLLARSEVTAQRLETDPRFGRSPETPILVDDVREPASIISTLSCGPSGDAHYVDIAIRSVKKARSRLVHRRAECSRDGAVLELWFDVTHARE